MGTAFSALEASHGETVIEFEVNGGTPRRVCAAGPPKKNGISSITLFFLRDKGWMLCGSSVLRSRFHSRLHPRCRF